MNSLEKTLLVEEYIKDNKNNTQDPIVSKYHVYVLFAP